MCCPLYGRVAQALQMLQRSVAAAPAPCPVGKRALGGSSVVSPFLHVCGEAEAFSIQRERQHSLEKLHGNSGREIFSGFLLKIRNS